MSVRFEPEVRIGGDSPTAQQAACSGLKISRKDRTLIEAATLDALRVFAVV